MNIPDNQLTDFQLLEKYADRQWDRLDLHAFRWRDDRPAPTPFPLSEKLKHLAWTGKDHYVIQLPNDALWYQAEGYEMQHCLMYLHNRYAEAANNGDIILFSMIDKTGKAVVDIELAVKRGYGVPFAFNEPTTTQIRGFRNECPPADHLIPDLMAFFTECGHGWNLISSHPNFDGKCDGIQFLRAYHRLTIVTSPDTVDA